ncbi:MAG: hypothetical protein PHU04_04065, partial [Candidatus Peribacteraceae bacterium]|nr:hypothetical protein [Candidatus Peribacteraceae bacterium]
GQVLGYTDGTTASDTVIEVLEGVEIRNKTTGRTVAGVSVAGGDSALTNAGSYHIYRFDDFILQGDEEWEFRVDFIDNGASEHPTSGDQFRIHICGEPTKVLSDNTLIANTATCDFGGLITGVTTYHMEIEGLSTGDSVGDVRPRGTITGNFHTIANATLTIAVKALNTTNDAVENASNINLLRFEARAGEAEDILFTKLIFDEGAGDAQNVNNYALWVDTDADGIVDTVLEDGVATQGSSNYVTFANLAGGGFVIPAEETVIFEVHGDVASSLKTDTTLRLAFATGSTSFVEAEELDDGSNLSGIQLNGSALNSATSTDILVTTVNSTLWSFSAQGNLFVTLDSTPVRNRQLLGGTLSEPIMRIQFRAENEGIDVTDIQLTSSGSTAGSVDRLELYLDGAATPFAQATIGGCPTGKLTVNPLDGYGTVASFCAQMSNQQFVVPEGEEIDVLIRARIKADTAGGTSNQPIEFFVYGSGTTATGAIRARGAESSNNLAVNDTDGTAEGEVFIGKTSATSGSTNDNVWISGTNHVTVMSKIESIANANPDPDNTPVPTGVTPFGQFKFTAAANANTNNGPNTALLTGIVFNVNATNIAMDASKFKFYNKSNSTVTHDCVADAVTSTQDIISVASGSFLVVCDNIDAGSVQTSIDSAQTATFVLEGEVTNSQVSASATSILQASLQSFNTHTRLTFGSGTVTTTAFSHIAWEDKDSGADATFHWVEYADSVVNSTSYKS